MLLAIVIAAIGIVFMTTSFFIVGEYNTLYAVVILMGVRLATAERLTIAGRPGAGAARAAGDPHLRDHDLSRPAALRSSSCGRCGARRRGRSLRRCCISLAAAFAIRGMTVAIYSVVHPHSAEHLEEVWLMAINFWQNLQFDLVLGATVVVVVWALVKPADLKRNRALCLGRGVPGAAGAVAAAGADRRAGPSARQVAVRRAHRERADHRDHGRGDAWPIAPRRPCACRCSWRCGSRTAASRFLAFAFVMLLAGLPADLSSPRPGSATSMPSAPASSRAAASSRSRTRRSAGCPIRCWSRTGC